MKEKLTAGFNEMCNYLGFMAFVLYIMMWLVPEYVSQDFSQYKIWFGLVIVLSFIKGATTAKK